MNKHVFFKQKADQEPLKGSFNRIHQGKAHILTEHGIVVIRKLARREQVAANGNATNKYEKLAKISELANHSPYFLPSFQTDGNDFVVFAKTGTLQQFPLQPREAETVFKHLCKGITQLHQQSMYHCDIKPENIVLRDNGFPAFIDFDGVTTDINQQGGSTPLFEPPELFFSGHDYNAKAHDIWSLAMTMLHVNAPKASEKLIQRIKEKEPGINDKFYQALKNKDQPDSTFQDLFKPLIDESRQRNPLLTKQIESLLVVNPKKRIENFHGLIGSKSFTQDSMPIIPIKSLPTIKTEKSLMRYVDRCQTKIKQLKKLRAKHPQESQDYQQIQYQLHATRHYRERAFAKLHQFNPKAIKVQDIANENISIISVNDLKKSLDPRWYKQLSSKSKTVLQQLEKYHQANDDEDKLINAYKLIRVCSQWLVNKPMDAIYSHRTKAIKSLLDNAVATVRMQTTGNLLNDKVQHMQIIPEQAQNLQP